MIEVEITWDDIRAAEPTPCKNPLARALTRSLQTPWCIGDDGFAYEVVLPHRVLALPEVAFDFWISYQESGPDESLEPLNFYLSWPGTASEPLAEAPHKSILARYMAPLLGTLQWLNAISHHARASIR